MLPTDSRFDRSYRQLARSLMERAPGFSQCSAALLDELVAEGLLVRLAAGETLLRRGERCDGLVMVIEGALESRLVLDTGRRHLLSFVLPGMFVGFLSVIDGGPLPHDVVAHRPAIVLRMPAATVQRLRRASLELHLAFELQLADRSRRLYDKLAESLLYPLRARLALQLVQLAESVGLRRADGWTIALRLSQADLADLLGASRQSVNTELRALQAAGLLRIAREHMECPDLDKLRAVGAE
ncbi:MAG: Crp/Fnr family transcriptional regulator [Burkholderiaceae bacterium]